MGSGIIINPLFKMILTSNQAEKLDDESIFRTLTDLVVHVILDELKELKDFMYPSEFHESSHRDLLQCTKTLKITLEYQPEYKDECLEHVTKSLKQFYYLDISIRLQGTRIMLFMHQTFMADVNALNSKHLELLMKHLPTE